MEIEYNAGVTEIISKDTTERVYIADVAFPLSAHYTFNVLGAWYIYNNLILYVPLAHTKMRTEHNNLCGCKLSKVVAAIMEMHSMDIFNALKRCTIYCVGGLQFHLYLLRISIEAHTYDDVRRWALKIYILFTL